MKQKHRTEPYTPPHSIITIIGAHVTQFTLLLLNDVFTPNTSRYSQISHCSFHLHSRGSSYDTVPSPHSRTENGDGESFQRKRRIQRFVKHVPFNSSIIVVARMDSLQHCFDPLRYILTSSLQISVVRFLSLSFSRHYHYHSFFVP